MQSLRDDEELIIKNYRLVRVKKGSVKHKQRRAGPYRPALHSCNSLLTTGMPEREDPAQEGVIGHWDEVAQIPLATVDQEMFMATLDGHPEDQDEAKDSLCLLYDASLEATLGSPSCCSPRFGRDCCGRSCPGAPSVGSCAPSF